MLGKGWSFVFWVGFENRKFIWVLVVLVSRLVVFSIIIIFGELVVFVVVFLVG